jgi:amidase
LISQADYLTLTATRIAALVTGGKITATEIIEATLTRLYEVDDALRAFTTVWADEARHAARRQDETGVAGRDLPLAGVPIGVKAWGGTGTPHARRLIEAGGIPIGTTSVPTRERVHLTWGSTPRGVTTNPWRTDRSPGGSSAGSAAAVAAGIVPLATGGDSAGSIRVPAAWCGVAGLKLTGGALNASSPLNASSLLNAPGLIARDAADLHLAASLLLPVSPLLPAAGAVPGESVQGGTGAREPEQGETGPHGTSLGEAGAEGGGLRAGVSGGGLQVGVSGGGLRAGWSETLGYADAEEAVVGVARAAAARLAEAGEDGGRAVVRWAAGPELRLLDPEPAWLALRAGETTHPVKDENDRRLAEYFAEHDLLITPTTPWAPHGHDGPGDRISTILTWVFNVSGHPAVSIPAGFDPDGLPVGLHLVAAHGREDLLLQVAGAWQRLHPWPTPPADL